LFIDFDPLIAWEDPQEHSGKYYQEYQVFLIHQYNKDAWGLTQKKRLVMKFKTSLGDALRLLPDANYYVSSTVGRGLNGATPVNSCVVL